MATFLGTPPVGAPSTGPVVDCSTCPSFLKPDQVQGKFRKATGASMCGRYGHVLDRPGFEPGQSAALQRVVAGRCPSYGDPAPVAPQDYQMEVALPAPDTIGVTPDPQRQALVNTCGMCKNFVRDDAVVREFGWTTGMCAAKGKLILPNRQAFEARGCDERDLGPVRTSTLGIHLLPEYSDDFGRTDPVRDILAAQASIVEPSEYPTDKPVEPVDQVKGIRAWRRVSNSTGEYHTFLPVYDLGTFDEVDRALIPKTGDDEHPELYVDHFEGVYLAAVCWTELDETPALWGTAGTGKTELFRHLAWLMSLPFRRISITGSTELDDLAGKMHFSPDKGTYFQYGRLPQAWRKPGVICIDEPNVGPPDVWQFIRPLTDNSKQLILDQNEGEPIPRDDDCYMGMAMNQAWDARNVGAMQIGDADANRLFHVNVPLPPEALEREIIQARVKLDGWELTRAQLDFVMKVAHDIRGMIDEGTLPVSWAIRPQIKVARAMRWFDPLTAYRRAVADYLEPEASQALLDAVRAHID